MSAVEEFCYIIFYGDHFVFQVVDFIAACFEGCCKCCFVTVVFFLFPDMGPVIVLRGRLMHCADPVFC